MLRQYEQEVGALPIVDETVFFDSEGTRMATVKTVNEIVMEGYQMIKEAIVCTEI